MSDLVADLARQSVALAPAERVRLMDLLLESLDDPQSADLDAPWAREIERRVRSHERGEGELFDVEQVMAEADRIAP
jgi:putative addiction module component (TIGR02574 family)